MRAGATRLWRVAAVAAFGATAALAVTLNRGAPVQVSLTAAGSGATHAAPSRSATGRTARPARCVAAGLRIWLAPRSHVTGATARYLLEFTNVSGAPCTLAGYPRVAAYRADGVQVGSLAAHDTSAATHRVLLAPGQTAHAVVDAAVPTARCGPVSASGLRVVAPGQASARDVRRPLTTCTVRAARGRGYLMVRAVQGGTGTGGGAGALANVNPSAAA